MGDLLNIYKLAGILKDDMKRLLILILLTLGLNSYSQTNFDKGFQKGYKKGYCFDRTLGCIEPTPPISPIPKIGEDFNSFQDGYNRGFELGLSSNKDGSNNARERYKTSSSEHVEFINKLNINDVRKLALILRESKGKAIEFTRNGDYESSINIGKAGLKVSPNDSEFMMIIAFAYLKLENYNQALIYLKKAVAKTNDSEIKSVIREIENGTYEDDLEMFDTN